MKKLKFIALMAAVCLSLSAITVDFNPDRIAIKGSFNLKDISSKYTADTLLSIVEIDECEFSGQPGKPLTNVWSDLFILPDEGNFTVSQFHYYYEYFDVENPIIPFDWEDTGELDGSAYTKDRWYPEEVIQVSDPVIMRDNRFCQISIFPMQYNPFLKKIRILRDLDLVLNLDRSIQINSRQKQHLRGSSAAFEGLYNIIQGTSKQRNTQPSCYLIISPESCIAELQNLKQWKERLGFKTYLVSLSETGTTNTEIKAYIQEAYDNWEIPPEFVILAGDVNGIYTLPSFTIPGYFTSYDVTDHSYTLLEGDDYFPDVMVGRLSFQSINELNTITNKIISYESAPYTGSDWFDKALMITYVNEYWMSFFSARETKRVIRDKLLDFNYSEVDTFYVPYQSGTYQLKNMINTGYTFLNYRGAGAPSYWWSGSGVLFGIDDIYQLNNGYMLPMVTSMTCGGGNFADQSYTTCFGEAWLSAGTPYNPKGAIGFIGPSELDTKTPFNNANDMGIYQGITQENLFRCGEMLLRGKMELYNNYPLCHEMDGWNDALDSDQFYFYVYNLLGDPGLSVWTDTPQDITLNYTNLIPSGSNFIEVQVSNGTSDLADFTIALTCDDSLLAVSRTDENGTAFLNHYFTAGSYSVTASRYGYIPETSSLDVADQNIIVLSDYELSAPPLNGSTLEIELSIQNQSDIEATQIFCQLYTDSPLLNIISSGFTTDFLAAEEILSASQEVEIAPDWNEGLETNLFLEIISSLGTDIFLIPLQLESPELIGNEHLINSSTGYLEPGETCELLLQFYNSGSNSSGTVELELESNDPLVIIESGFSNVNNIDPQETGYSASSLILTVSEETLVGDILSLMANFRLEELTLYQLPVNLQVGELSQESPTHSNYGYKAFESADSGNFDPPIYNWVEISPANGGAGFQIYGGNVQEDGFTSTIDLPFTFNYFGLEYDEISVCSNGYIAMGATSSMFFRNRNIPSGSGPAAMIAPFWDHLKWGDIFGYYDEDQHRFIIQWEDWQNAYSMYQHETFQVVLHDPLFYETPTSDGPILFQYKEVNNVDQAENYATVGIENHSKTEGILITYANVYSPTTHELADETAILFTTGSQLYTESNDTEIASIQAQLFQNYPNPFNPVTTISFELNTALIQDANSETENMKLIICNLKGQKIREFPANHFLPGGNYTGKKDRKIYSISWNGTDSSNNPVPSGIYFYKLRSGDQELTRKMVLLK
ncbi:MAG: hypothetical protein APR54_04410 [Candidatus Cloacimonas sp. SDB]|nr:MAG: hypothetical protein APR54_04410 [Candidatus Cloacimonas sp. SDB]